MLEKYPKARAAFASLGDSFQGPGLLISHANRLHPFRKKDQILPTLNSLLVPLPSDVASQPLHKIQGAASQPALERTTGSWWDTLLSISLTPPTAAARPVATASSSSAVGAASTLLMAMGTRRRCSVLSIPLFGLGNRLRVLASAHIYAEHFGCTLHVQWRVTDDMPHAWDELFANQLSAPPAWYDDSTTLRSPGDHPHGWLEAVDPYSAPLVIFHGGYSFKLPHMASSHYLWRKHLFMAQLQPAATIAPRIIDTRGFVCVHYRQHHAAIDDADLGAHFFERHSPLDAVASRVARLPLQRNVYVATTSMEARQLLRRMHPRVVWAESEPNTVNLSAASQRQGGSQCGDRDGLWHRRGFIIDWFALARCGAIIGSYGSSFSDEAVHHRGMTKECIGVDRVRANDAGYHALHTVADGQRFVSGWSRYLTDLYDESDPQELMKTYKMGDPLTRLFTPA